jgi:hypothetical protein
VHPCRNKQKARGVGKRWIVLKTVASLKSHYLFTFLAEKLLGRLAVPLVVVPGNLTDEPIANMT